MSAKKMGRPTESKKEYVIRARVDEDTYKRVEELTEKLHMSKSEIVRMGVIELYNKKD